MHIKQNAKCILCFESDTLLYSTFLEFNKPGNFEERLDNKTCCAKQAHALSASLQGWVQVMERAFSKKKIFGGNRIRISGGVII